MRILKRYIWLSLLVSILLLPCQAGAKRGITIVPKGPDGSKVKGNQWLFVIGIDTYIHWPPLKTAVTDAKSLRDVLLSRYHFDKDHLIELYNEQATRKNIIRKFRYLAKHVGSNDSLVIFYAGHGHLDPITKEGSWIPVESGTKDASAWISNHDVKNYQRVDVIKAKHILLISDSCFSGDFFRGQRGKLPDVTDRVINRAYRLTSRQAITSGGLEPVSDEGFGRNSVFSHFLLQAVRENQQPFLIPSSFFTDVQTGVAENAQQFPRFGSLKGAGGQQGGELVLFLKTESADSKLRTLSTQTQKRKKELERLRQMEFAAEQARRKESKVIAEHEKVLASLDAKIADMQKRLGTAAARSEDSLDNILAMVRQKEEQQRRLEELRKKRLEEEAKRKAEIERLKIKRLAEHYKALEEDIGKYLEIINSPYGKGMEATAWKALIAKYPESASLTQGDIAGLRGKILGILVAETSEIDEKKHSRSLLLKKGKAVLYVYIFPYYAEIYLADTTLKQGQELDPGRYKIRGYAWRHIPTSRWVDLRAGDIKVVFISLRQD